MLCKERTVTGIEVHESRFKQAEPVFVPGRPFHGLSYRKNGRVSIEADGERLISDRGSITFVPQGTAYYTEVMEAGEIIVVHFTATEAADACERPEIFRPEHGEAFKNQFSALLDRFQVGRERDYACMAMFYEILAAIEQEQTRDVQAAIPQRMREARERIERTYGDSALSISELAQKAGVSEVYFRKEFRRFFSLPPMAYIKRIRMDNAKLLLRTGYYSVGEVAGRCGFESLSYFSSEFHRMTGRTPTEYMKEHGL